MTVVRVRGIVIWHAACVVTAEAKAGLVSPADNGARIPIECFVNSEWLRA